MRAAASLLTALLLAWTGNANGYTRAVGPASQRAARWEHWPIELRIAEPNLPKGVSLAEATTALTSAIDTWKRGAPCAALAFVVNSTKVDVVADDGVNVVVFRQQSWCKNGVERTSNCYDPGRAAVTTLHFAGKAQDERIVGVDIELNAVDFDFARPQGASGGRRKLALSATLSHELGHVLGFGHPCAVPGEHKRSFVDERGTPLVPCDREALSGTDSLLAPSAESSSFGAAHLSADDRRGVCDVYAPQTPAGRVASSGCACNLRDRDPAPWSAPYVVLVGLSRLVRRRQQPLLTRRS